MSSKAEDVKQAVEDASKDEAQVTSLMNCLSDGSRRERQQAAQIIALVAKANPDILVPRINELVDALDRPEAQTRWEILDALTELVEHDSAACEKALVDAETALFDEDSGPLRLAAMCFLCKLGATSEERSEKTWPLIDEGIQCYHGDLEFQDMLLAVIDFSCGNLSPQVKANLGARMKFDSTNGKGALKKRATLIVDNVSR